MKNVPLMLMALATLFLASCKNQKKVENPFFTEYDTPFRVPPFDKIDTSHYLPAFIEGMKQQKTEINEIVINHQAPDFNNTILAYDKSGKVLTRVSKVFYNLEESNTNARIQSIAKELSPLISKHYDDISLNADLFKRIKSVYDKRFEMKLDSQQVRVVEKYYRDFVRQGADLPKDKQERLRKVNEELS